MAHHERCAGLAAVVLWLACATDASAAPILIDSFVAPQSVSRSGVGEIFSATGPGAVGVLGGDRVAGVIVAIGSGLAALDIGSGVAAFVVDSGTKASSQYIYSGSSARFGLSLAADLTGGGTNDRFTITTRANLETSWSINVYTDESHSSITTGFIPASATFVDRNFLFSSFISQGLDGPANFANANRILIQFSDDPGLDAEIDTIQAGAASEASPVPAPPTILLLGSGLLALATRARVLHVRS